MVGECAGEGGREGETSEQQEPSRPVVYKLTNHIRLKYDTRSVEREETVLFNIPWLPKHCSLPFFPSPQKCIPQGICFPLLLPKGGEMVLAGTPTHRVTQGKGACVLSALIP